MSMYKRFKVERLIMNFNSLSTVLENPNRYNYTEEEGKRMKAQLEQYREAIRTRIVELTALISEKTWPYE